MWHILCRYFCDERTGLQTCLLPHSYDQTMLFTYFGSSPLTDIISTIKKSAPIDIMICQCV